MLSRMGGYIVRFVANHGDGWLRRDMGGKEGRWVAKKGDGWQRREMGG